MLLATPSTARPKFVPSLAAPSSDADHAQHIARTLKLLNDTLAPQRRVVHTGDVICQSGERFGALYILNSGFFKVVNQAADGREQVVGLKFRGDWLGFDGIARGQYTCDAVAMDTGELWTIPYGALMAACQTSKKASGNIGGTRARRANACLWLGQSDRKENSR